MPRRSETGNVNKRCRCGRSKWGACPHPWHVAFKAPKNNPRRAGQRYRRNLDLVSGHHATSLAAAKDEARRAINAWLDGRDPVELQPSDPPPTIAKLLKEFRSRPHAPKSEAWQLKPIESTVVGDRRFGDWLAADITREALELFQAARPRTSGNRNLALLRSLFNWAVSKGLLAATPFKIGNVSVVRLGREDARTRRLQAGEEAKLIEASLALAPIITAALETGCRRGELLTMQWHQVRFAPRAEILLPAGKTKAKKDRRIPISTELRKVLEARRRDPSGELLPDEAYVFGDEVGRRRRSITTAWEGTLRRAKIVGLHFHDLRREAGSRWMDAGVPLATIQRWLGHHNISQTSTYLAASHGNDADDMQRFEEKIGRVAQGGIISGSSGDQYADQSKALPNNAEQKPIVH